MFDGFLSGVGDWFGGVFDSVGGWFDSGWDSLFGPSYETSFDIGRTEGLANGAGISYEDVGFQGPLYQPDIGIAYPSMSGSNMVQPGGGGGGLNTSSLWNTASKAVGAAAKAYTSSGGSGSGSATNTILASAGKPNLPTTALMSPRVSQSSGPAATANASDAVAAWTRIFMGER